MKTLQWFKEQIYQTIFRDDNGCPCNNCKEILENGLVVRDEDHARYIFEMQNDLGAEGIELNYRDSKTVDKLV
jgi:hypothetical protein